MGKALHLKHRPKGSLGTDAIEKCKCFGESGWSSPGSVGSEKGQIANDLLHTEGEGSLDLVLRVNLPPKYFISRIDHD